MFVQPYGLGSSSGGSRILSNMIREQPFAAHSVNTDPLPAPPVEGISETHLPVRPTLGRLDRSRFSKLGKCLEMAWRLSFKKRLSAHFEACDPKIVHVLPHGASDFFIAWQLARARGNRVVMSVHDDLRYTLLGHPLRQKSDLWLAKMWLDVDQVFIISEQLGQEYSRRYGRREYEIITDGVENISNIPPKRPSHRLHLYFMGLFHHAYGKNLLNLTRALAAFKAIRPELDLRLKMRCASLPRKLRLEFKPEVLPFANQHTVEDDLKNADLLYLPLPFDEVTKNFTNYSLSTKMVSYLASGLPILYHGPADSAAGTLLSTHSAAISWNNLDPKIGQAAFSALFSSQFCEGMGKNALALARSSFDLKGLKAKFLKGILGQD